MKPFLTITIIIACLLTSVSASTPHRVGSWELSQNPYSHSGIVWNNAGRGSATVTRHPKIAVSAAHVTHSGGWLQDNRWVRGWHSGSHPSASNQQQYFRGYWHWKSYRGTNSSADFSRDFVSYFSYDNLAGGGYAGWYRSNSTTRHPLNRGFSKLIVGYPGSDPYYMNATGPFTSGYRRSHGFFFWNSSVKGAPGMSGGGVFVNSGGYKLAGVHVAGDPDGRYGAGVRALDMGAFRLMSSAIASAEKGEAVTRTFSNRVRTEIPDNSSTWTQLSVPVSGMPSRLSGATMSLSISHPYRGDLQVVLVSPTGRTRVLHNRTGRSADHVIVSNLSVTGSFRGSNPNGTWKLRVRDLARYEVGSFDSISLTLTARN